jgi:capsular exopolysaccharide synthesis family protein
LPIVGHIPLITPDRQMAETARTGAGRMDPVVLYAFERSRSKEAEAVRAIRTALYFSTKGEGHKVIQVTSPTMGDGKSTLTANLAVSIAQSGKRVVVIDADFRRPRQHQLFGLSPAVGLASVISDGVELADAVHATIVPGLDVLPCGPVPPNPAELLTLARFEELLGHIRERYDYVLIDTPPLLAVTDPCVVAPRVDGVLLTLRLGKHVRPLAERARDLLGTLGVRIFGVVVNALDVRSQGGYGYDHYGYAYGYGRYAYDADGGDGENGYYDETAEAAAAPAPRNGAAAGVGETHTGNRPPNRGGWRRFFGAG